MRWVLQRPLIWILAYLGAAAINLVLLIARHGLSALGDWSNIAQALLFNQLPFLRQLGSLALLLVVPLAPIAWLLIVVGRAAQKDETREQQVLLLREALPAIKSEGAAAGRDEAGRVVPVLVTVELEKRGIALAVASAELPFPPPFDLSLLPVPETFVGRADNLTWVKQQLTQGGATAITALGGIGGVGKTALAGVAVRELLADGRFQGGVAVVNCANKADAMEVLRKTVARFNDGKTPDAEGAAALANEARRLLKDKDALVVLDNVEPELKEIARVVVALREAGATLLLTARHDLPASAVPPGAARRLDVLDEDEARALFTQLFTAAAERPLDASEILAVAGIVRTLGRHTLALRLAAVYAGKTRRDLAQLARELAEDPLKLANEDETPRGVALVLGRSVDALPAEARRLFAALAACATTELGRNAALALGEALGIPAPEAALDLLIHRALLDPTLEARMSQESDRERLRLHLLLRAYADSLLSGDDRDAAHLALATYYAAYANETPAAALGPDEKNITGALQWAHEHGQDALVASFADAMKTFWRDLSKTASRKTYLPLGLAAAQRMAESHGERDDRLRLARLQLAYAELLHLLGNLAAAERLLRQSLTIRLEEQDRRGEGVALSKLGDILVRRGDLAGAQTNYEQYRRIMQEVGDTREEGVALSKLGQIALKRGRLDEAAEYFQESLTIDREVQDRQGEGVVLYELALIAEAQGDLDRAEQLHRESLAIAEEVQSGQDLADSLLTLGEFLITKRPGKRDEGCAMLRNAIAIYHEMGVPGEAQARAVAQELGCAVE